MRFIDDNQIIILKIIHQRKRRNARFQAVQMSGIILDSRTEPCLPQHLDIEIGTFRNPLRFQQFIFTFKISDPVFHFFFNVLTCRTNLLLWHNIMGCRKNSDMLQRRTHLSGQRVRLRDSVYLIPEKLNANQIISALSRIYFQHIASHAETAIVHVHVISCILYIYQFPNDLVPVLRHAWPKGNNHIFIIVRTSKTIYTGNAGDYNDISPFRQGCGGRKS